MAHEPTARAERASEAWHVHTRSVSRCHSTEIVWAYTMKLSQGFTRPGATTVTLVAMVASFGLLSVSMKTLPLGTAHTAWTGIGAVGAFVLVWLHLANRRISPAWSPPC